MEMFREFWNYRELFFFMIWKDIKVRYKQTLLGASWAVLQPFFAMLVFTLFFGNLAKIPSDGIPYPIFSYSALLPWTFFAGALGQAGNSLVNSRSLITKVYFPRMTIPVSAALSGMVDFAIAFLVLLGMMAYYGVPLTWNLLLWPLISLPLVMLALGIGIILSALNVKYRDIKYVIPFAVQIWLFVTPVIYPASMIPERYRVLMALNPLCGIIEAFRSTLLPGRSVDWNLLWVCLPMTVAILAVAVLYFRKAEAAFADII